VLLFPEGTRSRDGSVGAFHKGAAVLAARGATIVPVGVAGTGDVLPQGATRPRSAPVSVVFGEALRSEGDPADVAAALRSEVQRLRAEAEGALRSGRGRRLAAVAAFARSRFAVGALVAWAVAEALAWPLIPDLFLLPLVVLAPARWKQLFVAALAGSLLGGMASYAAGPTDSGRSLLAKAPLVTERMVSEAGDRLEQGGAPALLTQPLAGIPYKTFSYQAAGAGVGFGEFVAFSAVARGARFLVIALLGALLGRWFRPVWERFGGHVLVLYVCGFAAGLARVVQAWS
jgi:membrane protein YqaA with SNARE-associated domain